MNELEIFKNEEFGEIRTVMKDGEPMFCLADVCKALEINNVSQLKTRLKEDGVITNEVIDNLGRKQNATFINEANLYKTIFQSRKESAERFTDWVTTEVLPSIRKTGSYQVPQTPEEQLKLTMQVTNRLVGRVDKVEKDIKHIKDTAEVDEQERYELLQARKARVMKACGGEDSNYYQEKKAKKVFAEFGRDFKKAFQIPRYDCLKKKLFDEAIEFTKNWYPSFVLQREIQNVNAQTRLDLGDD